MHYGIRWFKCKLKPPKNEAVYKIDYNVKGILENVIPVLDTFTAGKRQKFIGITVINLSDDVKWIPQGQYISTVHLIEGRTPSYNFTGTQQAWSATE